MIDGLTPSRVVRPASLSELTEVLKNEKGSVVPVGAGTQMHFGNPLHDCDCALELTGLTRITEYVPADLTIHMEAGVTLGELSRVLAENGQFVPLDPWNGPSATIGGIAAANAQGSYRAMGTIRDWTIGMHVVEVNGNASKTGGRVVKNVTGYDLAKLYTGSIGTLAVISEISLKVRAQFGRVATAIVRLEDESAASRMLQQIRTGPLQPVACEWIGPGNEVWVRFGEHPQSVAWQLKNLPPADWRFLEGPEESAAWASLAAKYEGLGPIVLKVIGLPFMLPEVIRECRPVSWIAHVANGIAFLGISDPSQIPQIRKRYRAVIERAPLEVRRLVHTFGLEKAEYALMLRMKKTFDPDGRLNPGRHVDGEKDHAH